MLASTTLLNRIGADLAGNPDVHALTDVTGFGILGHGLEMARASGLTLEIDLAALPFLAHAESLAREGFITGASHRNWASYGAEVDLPGGLPDWQRLLLADPQTSGGLLIACSGEKANSIRDTIRAAGYPLVSIVGKASEGPARIIVRG